MTAPSFPSALPVCFLSERGGGWGDCIPLRRARGARRSCFLMRLTPVIVLPDKGGPGGSRTGRKPGIVSCRGEKEAGFRVSCLVRASSRLGVVSRCDKDAGRRLCSHAKGALAIVFPHEVDAGYRTTYPACQHGPPPPRTAPGAPQRARVSACAAAVPQ